MTTADTLKLYAALHAEVPETRPVNTPEWCHDISAGFLKDNEDIKAGIALCRCATLSWMATTLMGMLEWRPRVHEGEWDICRSAMDGWVCAGASDDAELIRIAYWVYALQQTKGANRD